MKSKKFQFLARPIPPWHLLTFEAETSAAAAAAAVAAAGGIKLNTCKSCGDNNEQ